MSAQNLDPQFCKPFIEGTIKTFKIQYKTELTQLKPYIKGTREQPNISIAGSIVVSTSRFSGNIILCFTEKMFLGLMERMLGETFTEITHDLQDGVAELLNMIYGHAKTILNEQGYALEKALPTILRGKNLSTNHAQNAKVFVLPFQSDLGEFEIEVSSA